MFRDICYCIFIENLKMDLDQNNWLKEQINNLNSIILDVRTKENLMTGIYRMHFLWILETHKNLWKALTHWIIKNLLCLL